MNYLTVSFDKLSSMATQIGPYLDKIAPQATQVISKIGLSGIAKIAFLYTLYDDALANILALETNRHGTSIYSYAKIHLQGAKVRYGGHVADYYQSHSQNRVFVFEDHASFFGSKGFTFALKDRLSTHSCAMGYSQGAYEALLNNGMNFLYSKGVPQSILRTFSIPKSILSVAFGVLSPVVKFRFTAEQLQRDFKPDDKGCALYTEKDISVTHLGISGSLIQGVNFSVFKRIYRKPTQFLLGCVQLTAAVALTCLYTGIGTSFPILRSSVAIITEVAERHTIIKNIVLGALFTSTL